MSQLQGLALPGVGPGTDLALLGQKKAGVLIRMNSHDGSGNACYSVERVHFHEAECGFECGGDSYICSSDSTFIDVTKPKLNGVRAMLRARERVFQLSRSELMDITEAWVHAAFTIEPKDLAYMERLVMLQNRRVSKLRTV